MTERRRPFRRGRGPRPAQPDGSEPGGEAGGEPNPYRDAPSSGTGTAPGRDESAAPAAPAAPATPTASTNGDRPPARDGGRRGGRDSARDTARDTARDNARDSARDAARDLERDAGPRDEAGGATYAPNDQSPPSSSSSGGAGPSQQRPPGRQGRQQHRNPGRRGAQAPQQQQQQQQQELGARGRRGRRNGPPHQQQQQQPRRDGTQQQPQGGADRGAINLATIVADGEVTGWFDVGRDGGHVRLASASYLVQPNDTFVPAQLVKQYNLRRGDAIVAATGRDPRGRTIACAITGLNGAEPVEGAVRAEFASLIASYPERKLWLETGKPAKVGPELTRRAIDLIAPIGYGQRALIVAPARAGKTMLLQAIVEGVAINHPEAALLVLLVDERPEEVSEMITWGYGEVVASSFDMPAARHTDVAEMTLERARRLVEMGRDVVIVLDSITRLARAYNTVERGTGRTMSGGLDSSAMAKPKAFFGSARSVAPQHGGGSLTIIATALVETGSRMDDVIFEEFKGTGNCEIKLDRGLAEKRVFPAFDIGTSGTRREDKLFRPDQLDAVYTLRRGLQQMPPTSAMEWLIKRIGATASNDALLGGL